MKIEEIVGVSSWESVREFIRAYYVNNESEVSRRAAAAERDAFFNGGGDLSMQSLIRQSFADPENQKVRIAAIPFTKWNNVTHRIISEKATVYSEPAARRGDERYKAFLELIDLDEVWREANRLLALHEDIWVQYRVRSGDRAPVVDLVSPAGFWAINKPGDATYHVATLLDYYGGDKPTDPHYRLWTDSHTYLLDKELRQVGPPEIWPLGKMPGFVASTRSASGRGSLLASTPSADLIAAHKAVWFQDILLFKESKSANRQTYLTGDTSAGTRGQQADTDIEAHLPEGVVPSAIDRGMDLSQFRENGDHILERAGANHGLPPSVLHHRDSSSGAEVHLRRIPLRELRSQQIPVMRRHERRLAGVQSLVNSVDLPEYAFSLEGWGVDFGEVQQPLTEQERDQVFEKRRMLFLTSTVEEERRRNPDLSSDAEAIERIKQRVDDEVMRVEYTQGLQQLNGGVASQPGDNTAEENGASAQAAEPPA
jgi:hypothetical protein